MEYYSEEEMLKLDPEIEHIFKTRGKPELPPLTRKLVPVFRKKYNGAVKRFNTSEFARGALGSAFDRPNWAEADHDVPARDGRTIKVRTYIPKDLPADGVAVVVALHGGGWFMGNLETDEFISRLFCARFGVMVVNVDYGLYPEVAFPVPVYDTHDAIKWAALETPKLGANLSKGFILCGNSGGATYASIVAHLTRDEKEKLSSPITGCHFTCPIFGGWHDTANKSHAQNADAPLMNEQMKEGITTLTDFDLESPLLTPFRFESHERLPPTYIAVCGLDQWRDAGFHYKKELEKAGCVVRLDCYLGMPHCWFTTYPQVSRNQEWLRNTVDGMRWLLEKSKTSTISKL